MHKKKVLVYGTPDSLKNFLADSAAREFEIVAVFNKSKPLRALPTFLYNLIDGIIFTDMNKSFAESLLRQGLEPRKIILYDAVQGWKAFSKRDKGGVEVAFIYGLEFHIRNDADAEFFKSTVQRLQTQRQFQNLDPKFYPDALMQNFQRRTGKPLDLNNLKTFTEKLQWLKIFDATPLKSRLADKYLVRNWIEEKIGQEYLIPLLGVWDNFDDINFDDLLDQFVLKCNHGSGMNIIVRDKNTFDKQRAREKINAWLAFDFSTQALELHYTRINRKIIAEKFMTDGNASDLTDYKFFCFNGKPTYCLYYSNRSTDCRLDYFDIEWNLTKFESNDHPNSDHPEKFSKPKNFELMKKLATKLAENFSFVRVDFYEIEGRVYFGEMTFTPYAGDLSYKPEGTDEYLGTLLKLPDAVAPPPV